MSEAKKVKKPKSTKAKVIEWILTGIFGVLFIFVFAGFIDGMVHKKQYYNETIRFGWGTFVVETDSMADHLPVNSAIITYRDSFDSVYKKFNSGKKDIDISFYYDKVRGFVPDDASLTNETGKIGKVTTHRIKEIHVDETKKLGQGKYLIVCAGTNSQSDQNKEAQYQVVTEAQYLGVVKMCSNFLGGLFRFISSVWGLLVLLLIPACYLAIVSVLDIFKAFKEEDPVVATQGADGTVTSGSGSRLDNISAEDRERLKQELLQEMVEKKKQQSKEVKKDA